MARSESSAISRILVVVLDNLGDAVMATSVVGPLQERYPGVSIGFWAKQYAAGVLSEQTGIRFVHASDPFWDTSPGHGKGSWRTFLQTLGEIRQQRYDAAILLNTEWRRSLAVWLAGIPIRVGFDRRRSAYFLTRPAPVPGSDQHCVDDHRLLLEALTGLPVSGDIVPHLDQVSRDREWVDNWIAEQGWSDAALIALHPFAGDERRCWPSHKWFELMRLLTQRLGSSRYVLLCGKGEERRLGQDLDSFPRTYYRILSGLPLDNVRALIGRAGLFIGGDSGPAHLAAALETPVLSLFGDSDPGRCRPIGRGPVCVLRKSPIDLISAEDVAHDAHRLFGGHANTGGSPAIPFVKRNLVTP